MYGISKPRTRLLAALMLAGCTLSPRMPALGAQLAPEPTPESRASNASAKPVPVRAPVQFEYDDSADLSRYSVVTHPGKYFLWIQHPRLTFFVVTRGTALTASPSAVYLVFRTQSPQEVSSSHLQLICDGASSQIEALPTARIEQGVLTNSLYQTFAIPVEQFRHLGSCGSAEVSVGGVRAPFHADNMARLRSLADVLPHS